MVDAAGWFDFAIRDPMPISATNGGRNGGKGIVPHSAEGHWGTLDDLHDFHLARATNPDPRKRASWGATNMCDGRFVQHFSVWAQTWTSGSGYPNNNLFAFENEGAVGEPLTQPQIDNIIRVGRELSALQGWKARRPVDANDLTASCYEHTECRRFGSASTACPSGRIPWEILIPAINGEGADVFVRFNGAASFWPGKVFNASRDNFMALQTDFPGLPNTAKLVELDVRIDPTTIGDLVIKDGSKLYADALNRRKPEAIVSVIPAADGRIYFDVLNAPVKFTQVGIVGYWS